MLFAVAKLLILILRVVSTRVTNFRLTALQETGLYDLIVKDNAFQMFDTSSDDGGISLLNTVYFYTISCHLCSLTLICFHFVPISFDIKRHISICANTLHVN